MTTSSDRNHLGSVRLWVEVAILLAISAGLTMAVSAGKGFSDDWRIYPAVLGRTSVERETPTADTQAGRVSASGASSAGVSDAGRAGPRVVRPPTVPGQFYPADTAELRDMVDRILAASPRIGIRGVRSILAPHAGYMFSAEVAAASFREMDTGFRRVFVLASNHNGDVNFSGVSLPRESHYAVPGAVIPLSAVVDDLRSDPLFVDEPAAHAMHMIEVELPFLCRLRPRPSSPDFAIVPMILGRMDMPAIRRLAEILDRYADAGTRFVFSVDLSHYYKDEEARNLDHFTIQAIMSRDEGMLRRAVTDGNQVLLTMLLLAERRGWDPTLLMYRNSGDAGADRGRVVGYGSVVFHDPLELTRAERKDVLAYARRAVEEYVWRGRSPIEDTGLLDRHPIFRIPRAAFVTLKKNGRLRGCIGGLLPEGPLYADVRTHAVDAAVRDRRFPPVAPEELHQIVVSISILEHPRRVYVNSPRDVLSVLKPHRDGVILIHKGRQSTFLPEVWADIPNTADFLSNLCLKQGSPADCWTDTGTVLYRYSAHVVSATSL